MAKRTGPPVVASLIIRLLAQYNKNHSFAGDLEEEYHRLTESKGRVYSYSWYWSQCLRSLPKYFALLIAGYLMMFGNYVKISLRNSKRNKLFTLINVSGLSIGIICFLLIMLFVQYELSYDEFYENSDDIYRLAGYSKNSGNLRKWGWTSVTAWMDIKERYPEVVNSTRILTETGEVQISSRDRSFIEDRVLYADSTFFSMFDVPFLEGDPNTALNGIESVVISRTAARKYFGNDNPLGKTLTIRNRWEAEVPHTVTGVTEDIPDNSHFHYDFLVPIMATRVGTSENSGYWQVFNYFQLLPGTDPAVFKEKLLGFVRETFGAEVEEELNISYDEYLAQGRGIEYKLQPLRDIHLKSALEHEIEKNGEMNTVIIFAMSALLILLTACFNFVNLSTARAISRAKEVGIRKTLGSYRKQLVAQFLTESVILGVLSMIIALVTVELILPYYRIFTARPLEIDYLKNLYLLPSFIGFALFLGLITGSYPALYLSRFKPVSVLKKSFSSGGQKKFVSNILVVIQCAVSIALIAGTAVVKDQINFLLDKDMGYNDDYLLVLSNGAAIQEQFKTFKDEILKFPDVTAVAASGSFPTRAIHVAYFTAIENDEEKRASIFNIGVDSEFISTLGMELVDGRYMDPGRASDSNAVILNESAVKALNLENPLSVSFGRRWAGEVVGVVKDFHFRSLHYPIGPLIFLNNRDRVGYVSIRINSKDVSSVVGQVRAAWDVHSSNAPFNYSFLDSENELMYESEIKTRQVVSVFAAVAMLIGCLGLFGLTAYAVEQRTKEIGIRKVIGASILRILFLMTKDFVRIVGAAFVISVPAVFFILNKWLENFAYRIELQWFTFIVSGLVTVTIGLLAISYHVIRSAQANPVESLRHE